MITWNLVRAAGIGAFLMLWASVAWGLVSTTSVFGRKVPKATTVALHQALSTSGLLLLTMHVGMLLIDRFMTFTPLDLIVPMRVSYRPIGVALGIAAMYVMLVGVLGTSWGRKLIGTKWWRRTHSLSGPAFALALVHGLMTGTDTRRPGMFWMYVASAASLLFLLLLRAFTAGQRPKRAELPEGASRRTPSAVAVGARVAAPGTASSRADHARARRGASMRLEPRPVEVVRGVPTAPPAFTEVTTGWDEALRDNARSAEGTRGDAVAPAAGTEGRTPRSGNGRAASRGRPERRQTDEGIDPVARPPPPSGTVTRMARHSTSASRMG